MHRSPRPGERLRWRSCNALWYDSTLVSLSDLPRNHARRTNSEPFNSAYGIHPAQLASIAMSKCPTQRQYRPEPVNNLVAMEQKPSIAMRLRKPTPVVTISTTGLRGHAKVICDGAAGMSYVMVPKVETWHLTLASTARLAHPSSTVLMAHCFAWQPAACHETRWQKEENRLLSR